jgi:hypothetical protein
MLKKSRSMWSCAIVILPFILVPHYASAQPTTAPSTQQTETAPGDGVASARRPIRVLRTPPSTAGPGEGTAASRGGKDLPPPVLFAEPESAGITISPNPVLYFYVPKATKSSALVTLSDPEENTTLGRQKFPDGFPKAGIYRVQISDLKQPLKPEHVYTWTVSIRAPEGDNAHNAVSLALVRYQPNAELSAKLSGMGPEERARVLGENSIWYDAIAALSEAIDANPSDQFLRAERTRLLSERQKANAASFEQAK